MSKICFVADLHIKLGQKNVPKTWQYNRFFLLAEELNKVVADYIVIAGDLLDVADPSLEEVGLLYDFLSWLKLPVYLIPGNHEMTTKTKDCYTPVEHMLGDLNCSIIRRFHTMDGIDYIPYNILKDHKKWDKTDSKFAITHVRGEIPPHVNPEIDLDLFSPYEKVFAGDLHSVKNSQRNIFYPGSPFTTSFHRSISTGSNGYFTINTCDGSHEWHELYLPQLVRTKVDNPEDMVKTDFHHTIYELEGDLKDLAKVESTELLDKKINKNVSTEAKLNMGGDVHQELHEYLSKVKGLDDSAATELVTLLKDILVD